MRLYLVQHGEAVPKDLDPDRPLSDKGRDDIQRLRVWLCNQHVRLAQILHSGKTRARETAEILEPLLQTPGHIYEGRGLAPNDSPEDFLHRLTYSETDTLVAGHLPFVARAVSQALTGTPDRQLVEFLPGSIAGIERNEEAPWQLFMFARPESLQRAVTPQGD